MIDPLISNETAPVNLLFPKPETRDYTLSQSEMLKVSMFTYVKVIFWFSIFLTLLLLGLNLNQYGLGILSEPGYLLWDIFSTSAFFIIFFGALLLASAFYKCKKYKLVGINCKYGFCEKGLYTASVLHETFATWEYFLSFTEKSLYFFLYDGAVYMIIPKKIWTEAELQQLRGYAKKINAKLAL